MLPVSARQDFHRNQSPGKSSTKGIRPMKFPQGQQPTEQQPGGTIRPGSGNVPARCPPPVPPFLFRDTVAAAEQTQRNQRTRFT